MCLPVGAYLEDFPAMAHEILDLDRFFLLIFAGLPYPYTQYNQKFLSTKNVPLRHNQP